MMQFNFSVSLPSCPSFLIQSCKFSIEPDHAIGSQPMIDDQKILLYSRALTIESCVQILRFV
jgi:hypothetical protein